MSLIAESSAFSIFLLLTACMILYDVMLLSSSMSFRSVCCVLAAVKAEGKKGQPAGLD